ncbi:hypothetical protein B0H19DRAFT_1080971 [Mycena capillaripes]|nr:hypothetical protein B0H19DRAFT_1080971 [Mycena capillaripes]
MASEKTGPDEQGAIDIFKSLNKIIGPQPIVQILDPQYTGSVIHRIQYEIFNLPDERRDAAKCTTPPLQPFPLQQRYLLLFRHVWAKIANLMKEQRDAANWRSVSKPSMLAHKKHWDEDTFWHWIEECCAWVVEKRQREDI